MIAYYFIFDLFSQKMNINSIFMLFLQVSRHRRNHSQHVLKDVIPPLESLVSDYIAPH